MRMYDEEGIMGTKVHMWMSENDAMEFSLSCIFMWVLEIELRWVTDLVWQAPLLSEPCRPTINIFWEVLDVWSWGERSKEDAKQAELLVQVNKRIDSRALSVHLNYSKKIPQELHSIICSVFF